MKKLYALFIILSLALCAWGFSISPLRPMLMPFEVTLPIKRDPYILQALKAPLPVPTLNLPDISGYTYENVLKKIPPHQTGIITLQTMTATPGLEKFLETVRRNEFSKLQRRLDPLAIAVQSGVNTLDDVVAAVNNPNAIEKQTDGTYLLKVPMLVAHGATLVISGSPEKKLTLRMSSNTGGLIINMGLFFITDSEVAGWDDVKNDYAFYQTPKTFRPFFAAWNQSETYFARSNFKHLGYAASKSYGITFSSDKILMKRIPPPASSAGWLVENHFEGVHYGFYSYEVEGIVIVNNVYANNIVYGIDPHDRSKHLIIAGNETYGTQKKHGIIVSREVNDSWIFNNYSHDNKGSGIMLDRTCVRNIIANNVAKNNANDGMTLFESQSNIVANNELANNGKHGLRLRNSWDIISYNNVVTGNKGVGLQVYATAINDNERDLLQDPYTQRAGVNVIGGKFQRNSGGAFKFENFERLGITGVNIPLMQKTDFREDLSPFRRSMPDILGTNKNGIEIVRTTPETGIIAEDTDFPPPENDDIDEEK